ncbi:MAG: metallophosphoesterase [Ruminococcus sp.]|nr:metallophosphoesterase [Ruminococcus sp.]
MIKKLKKHKILYGITLVFLFIILFCIANIIYCNNVLTYSHYDVETSKIKHDIKFVMISDTEGKSYGVGNYRLAYKVLNADPEFVLILGDMVDKDNQDNTADLEALCKILADKVPVYYTLGNHENNKYTYENGKPTSEFQKKIDATGANLLLNEMTDYTSKSGDRITIAGMRKYPFFEYDEPDFDNDENHLFQKFLAQEDDSHYSILMCHYPEVAIWKLHDYDIDLMVSGHTHGGVIQIPFVGGIYAPEQGWFPDYYKGYYKMDNMQMIISAGLNNTHNVPRFNNPLDVAVVTLKATK